MASQFNISLFIYFCADYNGNNTWNFNGDNGNLNNNNRYNGNFRSRPDFDYSLNDKVSELCYSSIPEEKFSLTLEELLILSICAAKGKSKKHSFVYFYLHRIRELIKLEDELLHRELQPRCITAHIILSPRPREITCSEFPSRIIHTFYIRTLQPYLEQYLFHQDSYSCRIGKGNLKAIQQLQEYAYEVSEGYTKDCYYVKVDIQKFFMSLNCFQVYEIFVYFIKTYVHDNLYYDLLLYLTRITYLAATKDHMVDMALPTEREELDPRRSIMNREYYEGLPTGNWPSQIAGLVITTFALEYLTSLGYKFVHYTDDTTIVVTDLAQWHEDRQRLTRFYKQYFGLTLHPDKIYVQHISKGVELLGYKVRFNRILPSNRIHHNIQIVLMHIERGDADDEGYVFRNRETVFCSVNSYLGLLKHCSAYRLRREIVLRVVSTRFGIPFSFADDYSKLIMRPNYTTPYIYSLYYNELRQRHKNLCTL